MTAYAASTPRFSFWPANPRQAFRRGMVWLLVMMLVTFLTATIVHLEIPSPTGLHAVGRQSHVWVDESRPELHTLEATDHRSVPAQIWYPAEAGTGTVGSYVPDLAEIREELVASGELSAIEATGLQWVRHGSRDEATPDASISGHPVVIFSPGNQTNAVFYSAIAEELASHGYVVIGLDHPYQVAATVTAEGRVAGYDQSWDSGAGGPMVAEKIAERVADITFVLSSLAADPEFLDGSLDLDRVAVVGHSNGGLAAFEICRQRPDVIACANLDGQGAGGPFSTEPTTATAPEQAYLFLTKEVDLHPEMGSRFEAAGEGGYRIVVPAATHESFTDGSLYAPGIIPMERETDHVIGAIRGFLLNFLELEVQGRDAAILATVDTATDVYVNAYPLGDKPPIPASD